MQSTIDPIRILWDAKHLTPYEQVRKFHETFGYKVDSLDAPCALSWIESDRRYSLISEEFDELRDELNRARPDIVKIAHEAGDLMFVLIGLFVEMGIRPEAVVAELFRANMTKTPNPNGKATKGEGFRPADIERVVNG